MNVAAERAKSAWLLAFGDVMTLLITFFIMMIVINKSEVSKIQVWVDNQVTESYVFLQNEIKHKHLTVVKATRNANGILLTINHANAFQSGGFVPSEQLSSELRVIGQLLPKIPILEIEQDAESIEVIQQAKAEGYEWLAEVTVEGHTDNDSIDPRSSLRNNWFLSTLRAQAVMQELFSASALPASLFSVSGYGEFQPMASNEGSAGKDLNRRVEVLISARFQEHLGE
ncbi:OmpA/MotB family protein [Thiomicrorhabdus arctica]|jgi:chemotaxis protein MotB|uniref:OmpA/MotB family protein n=1 Tax=Thiomicrorhabdus arctica TaxID=131540 RepID=UPI00035D1B62|nr:OmpA family protein [Thiomicrorhabdus arctica]